MTHIDHYLSSENPDRAAETICKQARQVMNAIDKTLALINKQVTDYGVDALEEEIGREAYAELHAMHSSLSATLAAYRNHSPPNPLGYSSSGRPLAEIKADLVAKLLSHAEDKINTTVTASYMGKEIAVHERARDFWGNQAAALALGVPFRPFTIRALDGTPLLVNTREDFIVMCGTVQAAALMENELANEVCDRVMAAKDEFRAKAEATHYLET